MKLAIFLDVDGVLNHEPTTEDCDDALSKFAGNLPNGGFSLICPACVRRLNQLIDYAYAKAKYDTVQVILSSTWRRYFEPSRMTQMLQEAGFYYRIKDSTAVNNYDRGQQILDYLELDPADVYIVLDDDTYDMNLVKERQVVTYYRTGFDKKALEKAISLIDKNKTPE